MEKINIAEMLTDCPRGMKLYSPIFGEVYLDKIRPHLAIVVTIDKEQGDFKEEFLYDGRYRMEGECMLFPSKDKNTWEGFVPPYKFKDGDIVFSGLNLISIFKGIKKGVSGSLHSYVSTVLSPDSNVLEINRDCWTLENIRLATEEEKQKLFKTIQDNGYKWNAKTKTLEKLVNMEDKEINNFNVIPGLYKCVHGMFDGTPDGKLLFEAGNIYRCLSKHDRAEFEVSYGHSIYLADPAVCKHFIPFEKQGEQKSNPCEKCNHPMLNCHNFPCSEKKTFDQGKSALEAIREERVDNANKIEPKFKVGDRIIQKNGIAKPFTISQVGGGYYYVNDKNAVGIMRIEDQDKYELVPNKFDITTLKPFESRVLVRTKRFHDKWIAGFFSHKDSYEFAPFWTTADKNYQQCIPYENNEHLLGTTDDCDEYYKTWE